LRRNFWKDERGIIAVGVLAICFIVFSSVLWLVAVLIVNRVFDAFTPIYANFESIYPSLVGQHVVNATGIAIVVIDGLLLLWWAISAQRVESQEFQGSTF
jgi:hypothetical protein